MENKFITLGCRLNTFETEILKEQLNNKNITNKVIINTCAVTEKAEKESLRKIKQIKKLYPHKEIIVTGCATHTAYEQLSQMIEVSKIVDNSKKMLPLSFSSHNTHNLQQSTKDNSYKIPVLNNFNTRTRAFVQIQQGCDHRCSFCIINKTRGKSISLNEEDILFQVKMLVQNGYKEVTLTGVDISSWQRNIFDNSESKLGKLCINILKNVPSLKRLRLSSLDPAVIDNNLLHLLSKEERFMPHLHLSLQSLNNNVLNNMGRRHSQQSAIEWVEMLKTANNKLVLGADIICGFPKETEEQFLDTYNTIKKINIPLLHVFPYSERSNTPAAKMPQLPHSIRKHRAKLLIDLGLKLKNQFIKNKLGTIEEILIENNNMGYTKDYAQVKVISNEISKNTIVKVEIVNTNENILIGKVLNV